MKTVALIVPLLIAVGCGAPPTPSPNSESQTTPPQTTPSQATTDAAPKEFTITQVRRGADGKESVEVAAVTRDAVVRVAASLTAEPSEQKGRVSPEDLNAQQVPCSASAVQLYDRSLSECGRYGCNLICFYPDVGAYCPRGSVPNVYLGSYCHTSACTESWNSLVRSYWTGNMGDYAYLRRQYNDGYDGWEAMPGAYRYHDAGFYGQNADYLYFFGTCGN